MRISLLSIVLLLAVALTAYSQDQPAAPMMNTVDPASGRAGDVLTAQGAGLGQNAVTALYLTNGQVDTKVIIIEQTQTSIKFRIPPNAKAGRFALMVLTAGKGAKLIEEPVKVTVEPEAGSPET